ncbi:hypothetical protein CsatA_019792 [Cannabis sativa]
MYIVLFFIFVNYYLSFFILLVILLCFMCIVSGFFTVVVGLRLLGVRHNFVCSVFGLAIIDMANSESGSDSGAENECPTTIPTRGPTQMNEISKLMDQGKRVALEVNDKGQYCGKSYAKLVSTLGVRCRQTIGLAYKNWKEVNQTLKNKVWKDIQTGFIVPDTFKHDCLILAGKLMKDFKNRMTKDIIMPALKENDLGRLAQVPEKHPEIDAADWCKFVESRLTPEFLELSKVQRERSSKIQSRHRSGRSGMVNVREAVVSNT